MCHYFDFQLISSAACLRFGPLITCSGSDAPLKPLEHGMSYFTAFKCANSWFSAKAQQRPSVSSHYPITSLFLAPKCPVTPCRKDLPVFNRHCFFCQCCIFKLKNKQPFNIIYNMITLYTDGRKHRHDLKPLCVWNLQYEKQ